MDSIEIKIAKIAAQNWGEKEPENLEAAKKITNGSEISAIKGIVSVLDLDESSKQTMIDDVYNSDKISESIAQEIREKFKKDPLSTKDPKNEMIIKVLSIIHDGWIKNNADNFLKPGRNKERQFVPLQLLNWGEVESDFIFLKSILEAAGVEIDEEELKKEFKVEQQEYMIENKIFSHEDLVSHLSKGAESYPTLKGLETVNGTTN